MPRSGASVMIPISCMLSTSGRASGLPAAGWSQTLAFSGTSPDPSPQSCQIHSRPALCSAQCQESGQGNRLLPGRHKGVCDAAVCPVCASCCREPSQSTPWRGRRPPPAPCRPHPGLTLGIPARKSWNTQHLTARTFLPWQIPMAWPGFHTGGGQASGQSGWWSLLSLGGPPGFSSHVPKCQAVRGPTA